MATTDSFNDMVPVTASDAVNDPAGPFQAIFVSGAGTVRLTTRRGTVVNATFALGQFHRLRFLRVHVTGTTATGIFGVPGS